MGNRGFIAYHKALFGVLFHREGRPLSIRGRLQLSLLALSAALIFCTFFLLSALNLLPTGKNDLDHNIIAELDAYEQNLHRYFSNTAGMEIGRAHV